MSDKFQLHVSGLNLLAKCGIAFERRYVNGERTATSVSAAIGTAIDRSVTHNLQNKIDDGQLLSSDEVQSIARDTLVDEWARGVEVSTEDADDGLEFSKDKAIDRSVGLAEFHHTELAPRLHPTHVQRAWTLDITGFPLQLAGTIDIQEGSFAVRDTKSSAKSPVKDLADKSLQLTTYALAVSAHDGKLPERVILDYLVMTPKRGDKKLVQLESYRTRADFNPLLERIHQANRQIESGVFTPAPPDSWVCTEKFCSFWRTCRFAVRPVTVPILHIRTEGKAS